MKLVKLSVITLLTVLSLSGVSEATLLYGAATGNSGNQPSASNFYSINPFNGEATLIGPIGFNNVTGMVILPDGRIVATANGDDQFVESTSLLIEINPETGAGTLIGIIGQNSEMNPTNECGRVPGLTYDATTDTLFGYGDRCEPGGETSADSLIRINPDTGAGTTIGLTGFTSGGNGLAWDPLSGVLFATPSDDNSLITVNPGTGEGTTVPGSEGNIPDRMRSLAFVPDSNILYGAFRDEDEIFGPLNLAYLTIIDIDTGDTTIVGQSVTGLDAIVFAGPLTKPVPTLSQWGLIAMAGLIGIVGLIAVRKRLVVQ